MKFISFLNILKGPVVPGKEKKNLKIFFGGQTLFNPQRYSILMKFGMAVRE